MDTYTTCDNTIRDIASYCEPTLGVVILKIKPMDCLPARRGKYYEILCDFFAAKVKHAEISGDETPETLRIGLYLAIVRYGLEDKVRTVRRKEKVFLTTEFERKPKTKWLRGNIK